MKKVELHAKTKYSFDNESTLDIKDLILKCVENGEKGVAIVDTDSVVSFFKAEKILKELSIKDFKLVYGVELKVRYLNQIYKVVVLLKNKNGISKLFKEFSYYLTYKSLSLEELIKNKEDFVIGLLYDQSNYDYKLLQYFDYVEVDKNVLKDEIDYLKKKIIVVYSNRLNALSDEEETAKKVLYNKLRIKKEVKNRIYQSTEEILKEISDKEIVIDNPNKLFNMIDNFELIDDEFLLPSNNDFDIDLLVYISLNEKYGTDVPLNIIKRVEEELRLIHEYNYDGFINLYKTIIDKCMEEDEEYVICDYINYLYIAYLLGITHFDPIKIDLNYDMFFSHQLTISIKTSESFSRKLLKYIKNDLGINTIRCKSLMRLNGIGLEKAIETYENMNNIKFSLDEKVAISKYLDDYPINNKAVTSKELILPDDFNMFELFPREIMNDGNSCYRFINMDYKDIEYKFLVLEILSNDKITNLNELKNITKDKLSNCNYKDKKIIGGREFKDYLKIYDNNLILDDLYNDLINSKIELPEVFKIINEIRKEKNISKNTKNMLTKNNIKLKKYHDISFISRGILNEKARLEYELLYFKYYYPLEYYYVMLKNCPFNELIEILKKGYKEVINKIKEYPIYRYEYKYLNLIKEMYESNISFEIKERILVEDFCIELDKKNKKIILIINKIITEIDKYLSSDLYLIGTRPLNGKMQYMSKIIYKLLDRNTDVALFSFASPINYYVEYLLNEITGIDRKCLHQYLNPCSCFKDERLIIDKDEYMNGVKYLLNHNLSIKDFCCINSMIIEKANTLIDKIIYFINDIDSKVIIIDNIESINEELENILSILKQISKTRNITFIIFTNLKKEWEETHKNILTSFDNYNLYNKFINNISILDGDNIFDVEC